MEYTPLIISSILFIIIFAFVFRAIHGPFGKQAEESEVVTEPEPEPEPEPEHILTEEEKLTIYERIKKDFERRKEQYAKRLEEQNKEIEEIEKSQRASNKIIELFPRGSRFHFMGVEYMSVMVNMARIQLFASDGFRGSFSVQFRCKDDRYIGRHDSFGRDRDNSENVYKIMDDETGELLPMDKLPDAMFRMFYNPEIKIIESRTGVYGCSPSFRTIEGHVKCMYIDSSNATAECVFHEDQLDLLIGGMDTPEVGKTKNLQDLQKSLDTN